MKKKSRPKRLVLARSTLRLLSSDTLRGVAGGEATSLTVVSTQTFMSLCEGCGSRDCAYEPDW